MLKNHILILTLHYTGLFFLNSASMFTKSFVYTNSRLIKGKCYTWVWESTLRRTLKLTINTYTLKNKLSSFHFTFCNNCSSSSYIITFTFCERREWRMDVNRLFKFMFLFQISFTNIVYFFSTRKDNCLPLPIVFQRVSFFNHSVLSYS